MNHGQGDKMQSFSDKDQKRVLIGLNVASKKPEVLEECN